MEIDITNKCRVCLTEEKASTCLYEELSNGLTLKDILSTTTGIEVEKNDGLSSVICENCTSVIIEFHNLKVLFEENENQMRELLNAQKETQKDEEEEKFITIKVENEDENPNESGTYQQVTAFTCPECGDYFLHQDEIHKHMTSKHAISDLNYDETMEMCLVKTENTQCKLCNQNFESEQLYKDHLETHKKNVCDVCGVGFVKKSYLKDHKETHCPEKRYVCNFCNKAFQRRTILIKHKRIHTHPRQCVCEVCGKAFNDKGTLKTHFKLLHTQERNYVCMICGDKFSLKATLEKHVKRHQNREREFFCTQCPLGYRDKSSLDRHIYIKHKQHAKYSCENCGKEYTTSSNLLKHKRLSCRKNMDRDVLCDYIKYEG